MYCLSFVIVCLSFVYRLLSFIIVYMVVGLSFDNIGLSFFYRLFIEHYRFLSFVIVCLPSCNVSLWIIVVYNNLLLFHIETEIDRCNPEIFF